MSVQSNIVSDLEQEIVDLRGLNRNLLTQIEELEETIRKYENEEIKRVPIALEVYPTLDSMSSSLKSMSNSFSTNLEGISSGNTDSHFAQKTISNLKGIMKNLGKSGESIKSLNGSGPRGSTYYGVAKAKDDEEVLALKQQVEDLHAQILANNESISSLYIDIEMALQEDEGSEGENDV